MGIPKNFKNLAKLPSMEDLLYYAGIFDGEGYVTIVSSKRVDRIDYSLQVGVGNTYLPLLESLQRDFNIGVIASNQSSLKRGNLPCWNWRCHCKQASFVLRGLLPYLRMKQEVAKLGIEFQDHVSIGISKEWQLSIKEKVQAINNLS